ncbi:hypothetical protein KAR91_29690, partial [Candidatus Pacearchaeota archaeon]|nr:hypothetical protein [Candidatus Pacearchaeota archaeon]
NLLFINAGTDRVGIGTNTPGEKLEVAGNIEATGDLISGDDVIVGDDLRMTGGNRIYLDGGFANPDTTYIHSNSDRTMEFRCGGNIVFGSTRIDSNFYLPLDLRSYIRFLTMARPGTVANHAQIYGRLVGGVAYMMAQNDAGAEFNLTMDNHGSFYGNNIAWTSVAFGGGGTFVIISDANIVAGDVDDTAFQNNQELLIGTAGKYLINWNISVEASGANKHIEAGIGVDGTCNAAGRMHMETKTANEEDAFGGTAILDLAATNTISIMITNVDDNTQLEVHHVNLTVVKIGET